MEMFYYFWSELDFIYGNEETFEILFRQLAKREQTELISFFMRSRTTKTMFLSMSYSYRIDFIDHILQIKDEIHNEIKQQII